MREYKVLLAEEAHKIGCYPDYCEDYDFCKYVVVEFNDSRATYIGEDGGEPEDQLLIRNWR